MKKLNNTELSALAQKIYSESNHSLSDETVKKVEKEFNNLWTKFIKSDDYKVLQKYKFNPQFSVIKEQMKLEGYTFSTEYSYRNSNIVRIETKGGTVYGRKEGQEVSYDTIKRELILAQIEATDLESLVNKVKTNLSLS